MKVGNKYLAWVWDTFDLPIRFLYAHSGGALNKLLFWNLYTSDFEKLDTVFQNIIEVFDKGEITFKDKVVLELGPGNSYINAFNALMCGAKKVYLVDKFPRVIETKGQQEYFKKELDFISRKYNRPLFFIKNGKVDPQYIESVPKDLTETDIINVDIVISKSVFEHIKDVEGNVKKLSEILVPDGVMYHFIDLRDHYNFNNPFLFYKYGDRVWNKYLTKEGHTYTNRLRYDDFCRLFEKHEFEMIAEEVQRFDLPINIRNQFVGQKEDLKVGIMQVVLCKK